MNAKWILIALFLMLAVCVQAQTADTTGQMTVTSEYTYLTRMSGHWDTMVRTWPSAGDTSMVKMPGCTEAQTIVNEFAVVQLDSTRFGARQYYNYAMLTYDKVKHTYEMAWTDSRHSGMLAFTGALSDSGRVLTFEGERDESGGKTRLRFVFRQITGSHRTMQIWEQSAGNKSRKAVEIEYYLARPKIG
jgi:hypothetical protein